MLPEVYFGQYFPYSLLQLLMEPPYLYDLKQQGPRCGRREVAFGFTKFESGNDTHVIMQRYQTFAASPSGTTQQLLKQRFLRAKNNNRIDLGAVYSQDAAIAKNYTTTVEFRELIIDVDLDKEYKDFRTCECTKDEKAAPFVCSQCWPYLTLAMHTVDLILCKHFGFYDTIWLFSGRRGVHCWVLDLQAGTLSDQSRRYVMEFFRNFTSPESRPDAAFLSLPHLEELYTQILEPRFREMITKQQLKLSDKKTLGVIANNLAGLSDPTLVNYLLQGLETCDISKQADLWKQLVSHIKRNGRERSLINIIFYILFPRLDYNVMPSSIHLLRCPLSIHGDTLGVVTPLDLDEVDGIDPQFLPNLNMDHTFARFDKCLQTFQNGLLCRLPLASYLVCPLCTKDSTQTIDISLSDIFYNDKGALELHHNQKHNRALPSLEGCTLRDWVNRVTLNSDGSVDRKKKYEFYCKLEQKISR